jgi:oxygen-independent coproporphyrinogen-3 oxidase
MAEALKGNAMASEEEVARGDMAFEYMLGALRLRHGFGLRDFGERTGLPITAIQAALQEAEKKGLIERDFARVRPTVRGFDFLSDLQTLFLSN